MYGTVAQSVGAGSSSYWPVKKKVRKLNGYIVVLKPDHHRAMSGKRWEGMVYEHVLVAERNIGRLLRDDEEVHHLDGNRSNNASWNLLVLSKSQHAKLHAWLRRGAPFSKGNGANGVNSGKPKTARKCRCLCGKPLVGEQKRYCSVLCKDFNQPRKVEKVDKEILVRDVKSLSMEAIGRKYGVTSNAVRKWLKHYGLTVKVILSQAPGTPGEGAETSGEVKPS